MGITPKGAHIGKIIGGITTSVDGYFTGPDDGPGRGLGIGGERLHYWVFGGPWSYDSAQEGEATGEDKAWLEEAMGRVGAVVGGRGTFEAADRWGGANPWNVPFFIVTHRPEEQPDASAGFTFIDGLEEAVEQAHRAAADKDVHIMGGGDIIRQALAGRLVDELTIVIAPVVLERGKRLFERFEHSLDLEHVGVRQSPFATFVDYRVASPDDSFPDG